MRGNYGIDMRPITRQTPLPDPLNNSNDALGLVEFLTGRGLLFKCYKEGAKVWEWMAIFQNEEVSWSAIGPNFCLSVTDAFLRANGVKI